MEPCLFVMKRLEAERIFGTVTLSEAWKRSIATHPLAYLQHRASFMKAFLSDANFTIWTYDVSSEIFGKEVFTDSRVFAVLRAVHDGLKQTLIFRSGSWLLLCLFVCVLSLRLYDAAAGAFVFGTCASAVVYILTFGAVGVALDFRYAYWSVLAATGGLVTVVATHSTRAARRDG
jgi:hypothetical protein